MFKWEWTIRVNQTQRLREDLIPQVLRFVYTARKTKKTTEESYSNKEYSRKIKHITKIKTLKHEDINILTNSPKQRFASTKEEKSH